ncbi:MAG: hypothetical protein M1822_000605 [Bathelium mastoideum]|nr:MAG: hypothetical protein M1822_000605 [Bathelium mastoideum]
MAATVLILLSLIVAAAIRWLNARAVMMRQTATATKTRILADIRKCEQILSMKDVGMTSSEFPEIGAALENVMPPLEARARPNARLEFTFGISNAFTTDNSMLHRNFVRRASRLLSGFNSQRSAAGEQARSFIRAEFGVGGRLVKLTPLIQTLALRFSLQSVHGIDISTIDNQKVAFVAAEINRIWILSKKEAPPPWCDHAELHDALKAIFPDMDSKDSAENPLNLILPSYETLWRVVLRCFLEVVMPRHAGMGPNADIEADRHDSWRKSLHQFLADPSNTNLNDEGKDGVTVLHVVEEALRLYPPTRRVYRQFKFEQNSTPENMAADLEACQRNYVYLVEGSETAGFRFTPEHWAKHGNEMELGFMPFGRRPYLCPAYAGFAYNAIAILVGALSVEISNEWIMNPDPWDEVAPGQPLHTNREDYAEIMLEKL